MFCGFCFCFLFLREGATRVEVDMEALGNKWDWGT